MIKRALLKRRILVGRKKSRKRAGDSNWVKPYLYTEKSVVKTPRLANIDGHRRYNKNRDW